MTELKVTIGAKTEEELACMTTNRKVVYLADLKEQDQVVQSTDKDFLLDEFRREVKKQPKKVKKSILKVLQTAHLSVGSIVASTMPAMAATESGLPSATDTMSLIMELASWLSVIGIGISLIWLILSRLYYLHPDKSKSNKAMEILENALKGITQIIIVPSVVWLIIAAWNLMLGDATFFQLPL